MAEKKSKKKKSTSEKHVNKKEIKHQKQEPMIVEEVVVDGDKDLDIDIKFANEEDTPIAKKGFKVNKVLIGTVLLIAIVFLLGYVFRAELVVAYVNGQPITRLSLVRELESQYGKETLDRLVTKMLIEQEAKKRNLMVSDADVNQEIDTIKANVESQGQKFDEILTMQGMTMQSLQGEIKLKLMLDSMTASSSAITQDQIDGYLKANESYFPEEMSDADKTDNARKQLESQGSQTRVQTFLNELKGNADIKYSK